MTGTTSRVISECNISGPENGHLVALRGDTNNLLIGRCITIMDEEIEVSWFDGSYTTIWQPSKRKDPKNMLIRQTKCPNHQLFFTMLHE